MTCFVFQLKRDDKSTHGGQTENKSLGRMRCTGIEIEIEEGEFGRL